MTVPMPPATELAEKVRFLSSPAAYGYLPSAVEAVETHMSWVFLTGTLVYKFKKPVKYPFLDFTSLANRRHQCANELRLNRRLAPETYHRLVPLCRNANGALDLDGTGEIVEWVLEMQQLPREEMLDARLQEGRVGTDEVTAIGEKLGTFYAAATPQVRDGGAYLAHLMEETAINRELLLGGLWDLPFERIEAVVSRVERLLAEATPMIRQRVADGHIVEGHGDLRPEHVCLVPPLPIIDCLEFDRRMRLLDPYDEINYLGLECEKLGAGWIRPQLLGCLEDVLGGRPSPRLLHTYGAFRGVLRARICMAHLLDDEPMEPERWPAEARHYLSIAEEECQRAEA